MLRLGYNAGGALGEALEESSSAELQQIPAQVAQKAFTGR